jgi:hypothetical protein
MVLVPVLAESFAPIEKALPKWPFVHFVFAAIVLFAVLRAAAGFIFTAIGGSRGGENLRAEVVRMVRPIAGPRARWIVGTTLAALWLASFGAKNLLGTLGVSAFPLVALGYARIVRESSERARPIGARADVRWLSAVAARRFRLQVALISLSFVFFVLAPSACLFLLPLWLAWWASSLTFRADVGSDGVYIYSFRPRFVPFTADAKITWGALGFDLERRGLRPMRFGYRSSDSNRSGEVAECIRLLALRTTSHAVPVDTRLATLAASVEGAADGSGYRAAPIAREDLWRIAELATVAPRTRVKAIEGLLTEEETGDRERIDAIVETNADPATRALMRAPK